MVVGSFFSEVGILLLKNFVQIDTHKAAIAPRLIVTQGWQDKNFKDAGRSVGGYTGNITLTPADLEKLGQFLCSKRTFLLGLLENPHVLEHETFTNILWAVFHLTDELASRDTLQNLPTSDYSHLAGDIHRIYVQLIQQWLEYLRHLQSDYPYLFSLAIRKNPFDASASVIVKQ